jgi:MFS family permease
MPYGLVLIAFFAGLATFTVSTFMPFRFRQIGVHDSSLIGFAMGGSGFSSALSSASLPWLQRVLGPYGVFIMSYTFVAMGLLTASLAANYWVVIGALVVAGTGIGPLAPNLYALTAAMPVERRSQTVGIVKGVHYSSALLGVVLLEPLVRLGGVELALEAVAGVLVLTAILVAAARGREASVRISN